MYGQCEIASPRPAVGCHFNGVGPGAQGMLQVGIATFGSEFFKDLPSPPGALQQVNVGAGVAGFQVDYNFRAFGKGEGVEAGAAPGPPARRTVAAPSTGDNGGGSDFPAVVLSSRPVNDQIEAAGLSGLIGGGFYCLGARGEPILYPRMPVGGALTPE